MTEVPSTEQFWNSLPHCLGYPECDGDLVATPHEPGCPLFTEKALSVLEFAEAYAALCVSAALKEPRLEDIGIVRRRLFTDRDSKWNGTVRDITATLEVPGMLVDEVEVLKALATHLVDQAQAYELRRAFNESDSVSAALKEHTKHVGQFLNDMYATMIDPKGRL